MRAEVPVRRINSRQSRVSPIRHSGEMFRDLLRLRLGSVAHLPARDVPTHALTIGGAEELWSSRLPIVDGSTRRRVGSSSA